MRRALFSVVLFSAWMGIGVVASAQPATVRGRQSSLVDLSTRARKAHFELRGRAGSEGPEVVDHEVFRARGLSQTDIARVLAARHDEVRHCVDHAALRLSASPSEISISFVIEPNGRVSKITVIAFESDGRTMERCVTKAIRRWRFPMADAETHVDYPFLLGIAGGGTGHAE